ncbi:glycerophosphoryl diester phosphodiesterase membrane domain-containing protein [Streptomyces sp. C10-9-1]|uniref:glycerophosphoryl diester phosphodiesterase membrane domain-containing protein n=1 Tax=Streptomyces sp. C10-9-1 TaxID=1859285 RepID=UPI0021112E9D|nr:glycerophosphoryl diester phosphodiesterase membrane domain-containing protein [Streptomyces sp. C10-9-1]MCQ6553163.1 glycerophosphoryl diester phosphodiesterase membrane domain-containing protein [Streptomyces sp. C10-9-1]
MNDTPGWASPGSAPSDGRSPEVPHPAVPADASPAKWSAEQPPPGDWSTPGQGDRSPGGPAAGQGGGHPGPYGGGPWGGPPPAAKPGVIPLRPLGIGEILDGAVTTLRTHWRTVLSVTVTVAVLTQVASILIERFLMPAVPEIDPEATPEEALRQSLDSLKASLVSLGPTMLITMIGTLLTTALLTVVVSRSVLGRPVTLAGAWREARPRLPHLLGLTVLLPVGVIVLVAVGVLPGILIGGVGGVLLSVLGALVAMVVVAWLSIRFALAAPALVLERQGVLASLRRSARLVQGSWWRIFGITLLTALLAFLVSMVVAVPFTAIAFIVDGEGFGDFLSGSPPEFGLLFLVITGIGAVIASSITYPITAGVNTLLYIDQRIRREALDLELARAAGLPGYGPEPGSAPVSGG